MYPTSVLRWGDPVTVTGPFGGLFQGAVRVKFTGAPAMAPAILGPFQASVQVPEGAQTGECWVEINGRRTFGTQCVITPGTSITQPRPSLGVRRGTRAWQDFGEKSLMGYTASWVMPVGIIAGLIGLYFVLRSPAKGIL
jgi:hypothetical protein